MQVGDYVRTDKGEIGKLEELKLNYTKGKRLVTSYTTKEVEENFVMFDNKNITQRFVDGSCYYLTDDELKMVEESIIKSSPNIIDLIEVGDFVTYKNGNYYFNIPTRVCGLFDELTLSTVKIVGDNLLNEVEITSIVTKEQFESMEYRIEE